MSRGDKEYNPSKIEPKWQKEWQKQGLYQAKDFSNKEKLFLLVEFPYPSGAGLHVGHCRSYTAMDVLARKRRMQGQNVLFPMGWDAFGLPSENFAIKTGIHPSITTKKSIATFKKQEQSLGFSFDWSREINTTDPNYYKWTQWIFLKLFENGLAYKAKIPINWCLSCKIGLANEEVVDGKCERCGGAIEKREKEQWLIKITKYAQRLIDDLALVDFPERVKAQQINWIGKSDGWQISFSLVIASPAPCHSERSEESQRSFGQSPQDDKIKVFTTRVDTIFGVTYLVVAPEHPILDDLKSSVINYQAVKDYLEKTKKKSDLERQAEAKEKTGIKIDGISALNPATGQEIPIFVADYVLTGYGTGAIMAVPAHDQRDFDFATKYDLPITEVIGGPQGSPSLGDPRAPVAYVGEGVLVNSGEFDGMKSEEARDKMGQWLKEKGVAEPKINYKLRDWVFSRQHYWGEPIPLVFCQKCGWQAVPEKDLPVELPKVEKYQPTDTGESPLAGMKAWLNTKCPKCASKAQRETDTMPNWAGSNWYFMRYCDPNNKKEFASQEKLKYWMPVDWYNGGMEHTTLHLLYSRFIYKFLWDIGQVPKELGPEPYKKRTSHGMILAEGGVKMSKSKGNVVNPDDVVKEYGADTLRVYEMFMGPFDQAIAWDTNSIKGSRRFLERVYALAASVCHPEPTGRQVPWGEGSQKNETLRLTPQGDSRANIEKLLHQTIKKVSEDIESMKFNTAISALMILLNEMEKEEVISANNYLSFIILLSPFAPHIAEQLFSELKSQKPKGKSESQNLKVKKSIFEEDWPSYDEKLIKDELVNLIIQVNGKVRANLEMTAGATEAEAKEVALKDEKVAKWLSGQSIKKIIFVKEKLINFVI